MDSEFEQCVLHEPVIIVNTPIVHPLSSIRSISSFVISSEQRLKLSMEVTAY